MSNKFDGFQTTTVFFFGNNNYTKFFVKIDHLPGMKSEGIENVWYIII